MSNLHFKPTKIFAALLTCLLMTSCGGGGSSTTPTPTPTPTPNPTPQPVQLFTEVSTEAGLPQASVPLIAEMSEMMNSAVTVGDYNNDGWLDIYLVRSKSGNLLYQNNGDGTFSDKSAQAGVDVHNSRGASASFVDFDSDGWLDLFVSSFADGQPTVFRNTHDGKFENVTASTGLETANKASFSMAFGDYDQDGDIDMFVTHWKEAEGSDYMEYLWANQGDGTFVDASDSSGIKAIIQASDAKTFTPNFTDVNNDGWPDLTIASDFETTRLLINNGGTFVDATTDAIDDENGMGASMGDFDNDGDLDWFVTSILDGNGSLQSGNRLYQNDGQGNFTDVSLNAGVRQGHWGWGACFADFNNDTFLDIFHVNGFGNELSSGADNLQAFYEDPSKLFISNGDMTFTDKAVDSGIDDDQQGRGIVCFDYDRDGDQDILISNFAQPLRLYRNDSITNANYLGVKLVGKAPNTQGIGARVYITVGGEQQMREIRNGNNYLSSNPVEAHFGLAGGETISEVKVVWPDHTETVMSGVTVNQMLEIAQPE